MHKVYAAGAPDRTSGAIVSASDALRISLTAGVAEGADAVAHTGDLVNFPSPAAVANAQKILEETGAASLPFLYISVSLKGSCTRIPQRGSCCH